MVRCLSLLWWAASTASTCSSTWFCMSTGLRPGLYYYQSLGQGRVTWPLHQALTWPCSSPPNGIPSSQSGLPPSPLCKASQLPQCQTSFSKRSSHHFVGHPHIPCGPGLEQWLGDTHSWGITVLKWTRQWPTHMKASFSFLFKNSAETTLI